MRGRTHRRALGALLLAGGLAAALAGCGKKSALEPPPGEASRFPRVYPSPATTGAPAHAPRQAPTEAPAETLTLPPSQMLPSP